MGADLTRIAFECMNAGKLEEAEAHIRQALSNAPEDLNAMYVASLIFGKKGDINKEMEFAENLINIRPRDAMMNRRYAWAKANAGDKAGFAYYFRQASAFKIRDQFADAARNYVPNSDLIREGSVVMGLAANYRPEHIAPFVISLRQSGYDGDIVLFVDNESNEMIDFLEEYSVTGVFSQIQNHMDCFMSQSRYLLYYDYLKKNIYKRRVPARVFLTDVRDVFFQKSPFDIQAAADVTFFLEDAHQRFGHCPTNSNWVKVAFGDEMLGRFSGRRVSCGGTTLGTYDGIIRYLLKNIALISGLDYAARQNVGVDQVTHNYITYFSREKNWEIRENGEGLMTCWSGAYQVNSDGLVCNRHGTPQAVIHQYDRFEDLTKLVKERYSL